MKNRKSSPVATFIVGLAFIIGAWFAYTNFSKPMAEEAKSSESWPSVPGLITNSEVRQSVDNDGKTMYAAQINYDFMVDNKTYSGNSISLTSGNTTTSSIRSVKKDLQKYPVGAEVTVYYDPELPNHAVLKPGADTFTTIIKYAPFLFGFFGILMLLQVFKKIGILLLALFIGTRK